MTDLERFVERLVRNLVAVAPARIREPIALLDIKTELVPYRTNRRALGLESNDEYEELLIRLVGGEGDLVKTHPPEVAEWCQRQMASLTPDLSGIPGQAGAALEINPAAIARLLGAETASRLAQAGAGESPAGELPLRPEQCLHCHAPLPANRAINFCPVCGRSVLTIPCDHCGADMEPGWRFCVNCGQETTDAGAASAPSA